MKKNCHCIGWIWNGLWLSHRNGNTHVIVSCLEFSETVFRTKRKTCQYLFSLFIWWPRALFSCKVIVCACVCVFDQKYALWFLVHNLKIVRTNSLIKYSLEASCCGTHLSVVSFHSLFASIFGMSPFYATWNWIVANILRIPSFTY